MGTSSAQRSPSTPEWDRVKELYRQPQPPPGEVVSRIIQALDPDTRQDMHDRAVTAALDTLLWGSASVADQGLEQFLQGFQPISGPPVVALAAALRDTAVDYITTAAVASRFGELAIDALSNTVLAVAAGDQGLLQVSAEEADANYGGYARESNLSGLSVQFFSHDFDRVLRYFVSRDLSDFIGTEALPTVSSGSRLLDDVAHYCRQTAQQMDLREYEDRLQQAIRLPIDQRIQTLQPITAEGITVGLGVLAGGI